MSRRELGAALTSVRRKTLLARIASDDVRKQFARMSRRRRRQPGHPSVASVFGTADRTARSARDSGAGADGQAGTNLSETMFEGVQVNISRVGLTAPSPMGSTGRAQPDGQPSRLGLVVSSPTRRSRTSGSAAIAKMSNPAVRAGDIGVRTADRPAPTSQSTRVRSV